MLVPVNGQAFGLMPAANGAFALIEVRRDLFPGFETNSVQRRSGHADTCTNIVALRPTVIKGVPFLPVEFNTLARQSYFTRWSVRAASRRSAASSRLVASI
jgi:hypothetical protein